MKDAKGHGSDPHGGAAHQEGVARATAPGWSRQYAGRYIHTSGHAIERSNNGGWNVVRPTGKVLDNLKTKREALRIYRNIES